MALEEAHHPFEMDARTLESRGYVRAYKGKVTAHPKIDPVTGEMVWFGYGVGEAPLSAGMSYGVTAADGTVVRRDDFQAPFSSMVHDFMVTQNYVLFPVLPLTGSLQRAMSGLPPFATSSIR
jgi:carotenoid cleavage dioxygenase